MGKFKLFFKNKQVQIVQEVCLKTCIVTLHMDHGVIMDNNVE